MKYYIFILIIAFTGCKSKQDFELEILTKEVNYLDVNKESNRKYYLPDQLLPKESSTIITYKLTNNTDDTYYFNISDLNYTNKNTDNYIQIDKAFIGFIDKSGKLQHVRRRDFKLLSARGPYEYLDYKVDWQRMLKSFVIHPGETLYFEWFTVLPFGTFLEDLRYNVVLDKNESYFAQLFMYSDTKDYKKRISRTDLKTIEENGYKVFDGVIKSKNKIPVVFRKESKVSE